LVDNDVQSGHGVLADLTEKHFVVAGAVGFHGLPGVVRTK
jgi:hypothetical protein